VDVVAGLDVGDGAELRGLRCESCAGQEIGDLVVRERAVEAVITERVDLQVDDVADLGLETGHGGGDGVGAGQQEGRGEVAGGVGGEGASGLGAGVGDDDGGAGDDRATLIGEAGDRAGGVLRGGMGGGDTREDCQNDQRSCAAEIHLGPRVLRTKRSMKAAVVSRRQGTGIGMAATLEGGPERCQGCWATP